MNTKKLFHFCLFLLVNVYSKNVNDKHYKKNNQNNKKKKSIFSFGKNPYHIFKLAPWKSFSEFEKKYYKLKEEALYTNNYNIEETKEYLEELDEAFLQIKKDNNKTSNNFINITIYTIIQIIIYSIFAYLVRIAIFIFYKFQGSGNGARFQIITSVFISKFFPHYFDSQSSQYVASLISGYFLKKFVMNIYNNVKKSFSKKKEDNTNSNINDNDTVTNN